MACLWIPAVAQDDAQAPPPFEASRLRGYLGGQVNVGIQRDVLLMELTPLVGIQFATNYAVGLSPLYVLRSDRILINQRLRRQIQHAYGALLFARRTFWKNLMLHIDGGWIHYDTGAPDQSQFFQPTLGIGGGLWAPFRTKGGISFLLIYNPLYEPTELPYLGSLNLRVGVVF